MPGFLHAAPETRAAWSKKGAAMTAARKIVIDPETVTFGVEIETALPKQWAVANDCRPGNYHSGNVAGPAFPDGWTVERDGSISLPNDDDWNWTKAEFISPVLTGIAGLRQVMDVVNTLEAAGAKTNPSTGIHVHIGIQSILGDRMQDFEIVANLIYRIICTVSNNEKALIAVSGTTARINNHYAASVKAKWATIRSWVKLNHIEHAVNASGERYYILNIKPLFDHRHTIEFRAFASTLNANKVAGYITTCIALVCKAAANGRTKKFNAVRDTTFIDAVKAVKAMQKEFSGYGLALDPDLSARIASNQIFNAKQLAAHFTGGQTS